MRRFLFLLLVLTIGIILIPAQFALAAPCGGSCGDEATCGGTACGENNCPCDTGGTCVCIDNQCKCGGSCGDEKGCSAECPTKAACRPAIASADIENAGDDGASGQDDGTADIDDQTESGANDDADREDMDQEGPLDEAADVENADAEEGGSSMLLYIILVAAVGGGLAGFFLIIGRKKTDQDDN